jgi:hypothetical protein
MQHDPLHEALFRMHPTTAAALAFLALQQHTSIWREHHADMHRSFPATPNASPTNACNVLQLRVVST